MTPQEWIEEANRRWRWPHGVSFAVEGAQHLAAALAEISQLREKVAAAEEFAENMRQNRDEVLRTSQQDARDAARLRLVVQNVHSAIANEVRR